MKAMMTMDKLLGTQATIITLDVDSFLFDKLNQLSQVGFSIVEINSTDVELFEKVLNEFPKLCIGSGNIITTQQLEDMYQAGVHFVTSPGFLPELAKTASIYSIKFIPGIATLSEAMQAMTLGCEYVRPFPASLSLCTLINKSLPSLRLLPAEVEWDEVEHFLNLPAVAAVSIINPEIKQLRLFNPGAIA